MIVAWTNDGAGEKWSDPRWTLKIEPKVLAEIFII